MNTLFYEHRYSRPFPFTLLLLERIETLNERGDLDIPTVLHELFDTSADDMREAVEYMDNRLAKLYEKQAKPKPTSVSRKTLGYALTNLLSSLSLPDMLIMAFGLVEARRLYCEEDMDDVIKALDVWQTELVGRHTMSWEASMYGAGGGYKDDGEESGPVIDMTTDEGFDALKAFAAQINGVFH